jgi:long-chain acyl-CoA synthetase
MNAKPWLATCGDRIPADINADHFESIVRLVDAAIPRWPDHCAFRSLGHSLSYREFDARARDFAAFLQSGLGAGGATASR